MPIKILLAGASTYGVKNMGDDAMLYTLTQELHRRLDCEITFLARHPNSSYDKLYGIRSIKNYEHDSKANSLGRWFFGFNPGDPHTHLDAIRTAIAESDLVVLGGNSFMEVSLNQFLRGVASYSALLATFSMFFNKPFALYGVAGHEMKSDFTKEIARFLAGNAKLVTVREEFFKNALKNAGVSGDHIRVGGDPAFGIEPIAGDEKGRGVLDREKIRFSSKTVIGIGFRHMYWVWNEQQTAEYMEKMAGLCDHLIEAYDADLLFIPNCTYDVDTPLEDDRHIAGLVRARMRLASRTHCPKGEMDLLETLSLYRHINILASNRRHSNIFAAVHGKPFFPFSSGHPWQFKPFIKDLGIDVPLSSITEDGLETLKQGFATTWKSRPALVETLKKNVPALRNKAREQVGWIANLANTSAT